MAALLLRYTSSYASLSRQAIRLLPTYRQSFGSFIAIGATTPGENSCSPSKRHFSLETNLSNQDSCFDENLFSQINLVVKGSDEAVLDSYAQFMTRAAKILNIDVSGRTILDTHIEKRTLLKSPHIYKKHQVQYEVRTHGRMVQVRQITGSSADIFLEYIQRNLPAGVSMNIEQTELMDIPEYIRPPVQLTHESIMRTKQEKA